MKLFLIRRKRIGLFNFDFLSFSWVFLFKTMIENSQLVVLKPYFVDLTQLGEFEPLQYLKTYKDKIDEARKHIILNFGMTLFRQNIENFIIVSIPSKILNQPRQKSHNPKDTGLIIGNVILFLICLCF